MELGKWLFTCDWNNTYGGGFSGQLEVEEIQLNAATEEEAIREAKVLWIKKQEEAISEWKKKSDCWAHPPKNAFVDGPSRPRVIYVVEL